MHNFEPLGAIYLDKDVLYSNVDAETINAGVEAAATLGTLVANRPRNTAKKDMRMAKKQGKADNKSACGKRPILAKNRASWNKCVADFSKNKGAAIQEPISTSDSSADQYAKKGASSDGKVLGMPMGAVIGVSILALAGIGFFVYKKFFSHTPVAIPLAT